MKELIASIGIFLSYIGIGKIKEKIQDNKIEELQDQVDTSKNTIVALKTELKAKELQDDITKKINNTDGGVPDERLHQFDKSRNHKR